MRTVAQIFPSAKAAAEDQRYFSSAEGRDTIVARYLESFLKGSFEPRDVQVRALPVKGTDSAGLAFTFDAPKGRILGVMVTSRVGSARGNLTVMGFANEMRPTDAVKLLPLLRTRLGRVPVSCRYGLALPAGVASAGGGVPRGPRGRTSALTVRGDDCANSSVTSIAPPASSGSMSPTSIRW